MLSPCTVLLSAFEIVASNSLAEITARFDFGEQVGSDLEHATDDS